MKTSQGQVYAAPIVASNVIAGKMYCKQTGDTTPFTVLWITNARNGYMVDPGHDTISNHRKAIVMDSAGDIYMRPILANSRYFEVKEDGK